MKIKEFNDREMQIFYRGLHLGVGIAGVAAILTVLFVTT